MHPFEYMIAVDFEATCWENEPISRFHKPEIIEFPAVLFNLKSGKIESIFHQYILPVEFPTLSAFCTHLTGITQVTVDQGITLQAALSMFHDWVAKEMRARNLKFPKTVRSRPHGNCALTTWTDWDFGVCLDKECKRKGLMKPNYFNQWIDARAIFRDWYRYRPAKFLDALKYVGLEFQGRAHSGIDDAKNLAALICKMAEDGAPLAITKDLTPLTYYVNGFF